MNKLQILCISGSLKSTSSNTTILKNIMDLDEDIDFHLYEGLKQIPPFDPEADEGTAEVNELRKLVKETDAVIICTPEYAFGVPGVLKNALDWMVSSGELNEKPALAISASPMYEGGKKALSSLLLTLSALGTKMDDHSSLSIPDILKKIDAKKKINDPQLIIELNNLLFKLKKNIRQKQ